MKCVKIHRLIKSYFGNYRNFIAWCAAVALAVFTIDALIAPKASFPKSRRLKSESVELSMRTIAVDIADDQEVEIKETKEEYEEQPKVGQQKQVHSKKSVVHPGHCGLTAECPRGKYSFYVRSGYGRDVSAVICFNENYIIAEDKVSSDRGLNMIVINDDTLNVEEIKVFDVYSSDAVLLSYLQNNIKDNHIIIVASHDEASFNLTHTSRKEFYKFGSSILDQVNFRDNYVILGQKGIAVGQAIEGHEPRSEERQFAESAVISGCVTIPVGKEKETKKKLEENKAAVQNKDAKEKAVEEQKAAELNDENLAPKHEIKKPEEQKEESKAVHDDEKGVKEPVKIEKKSETDKSKEKKTGGAIKMGEQQLNCGVKGECPHGEFSVHLYTGFQAKELPNICVSGKYVMSTGLNDAGRGLNFVVVDAKTKEVSRVARFDTYNSDDNALEMFLEMLNEDDIILAVAHDEASNRLNKEARDLIQELGSSFISRLSFRDVWAFIGQKGLSGFSPYEAFEVSGANSEHQVLTWPTPIDMKLCVPLKLKALPQKKILLENEARVKFCNKHDGYGDFCSKDNINLPLEPAPLAVKFLANHKIFTIPIAVISGLEYNSLRKQLEALLANPGIKLEMIKVFYDEKFEEAGDLAAVFGITSHKLESSIKYTELMEKAIKASWKLFPQTKHMIILEEESFPSTDFLNFFRQCLPAVDADDTLAGISAWNDNSYKGRAGIRSLAYRVEMLPGIGFLLKKSFYEEQMNSRMTECCMLRSWEGWTRDDMNEFEMIIPDVSRIERGPYNGRMTNLLSELFQRPREMTGYGVNQYRIVNAKSLVSEKYESQLEQIIPMAGSLNRTELKKCLNVNDFVFPVDAINKGSYAVYYEQESTADERLLNLLCQCFDLFHVPGYRVRGTHRGLVRFSHDDHMVFLIGSKTEYFNHKPSGIEVLRLPANNK